MAKARSISNVRECDGKPNGGVMAQHTYWRGSAHSNSEDSIGTRNHAKREKQTKTKTRFRGREAVTGRVRDFADTEHIKERHLHGQC